MMEAKKLYDEFGTLQKVADVLKLTRERVRQLLKRGEKHGLFKHQTTRTKRFIELTSVVSKENLTQEIRKDKTIFEICSSFGIGTNQYFKLIKFYNIDLIDYRLDAKRRKFIAGYMKIVNFLGHHPSTTEMNSKSQWRNIWHGIDRCWGSIKNFRSEYGIEKPKMAIHPNTINSFHNFVENKKKRRREKINRLIEYLKTVEKITSKEIMEKFNISKGTVSTYTKELMNNGTINALGGNKNRIYLLVKKFN